jgi:hypothetical protein
VDIETEIKIENAKDDQAEIGELNERRKKWLAEIEEST